MNQTAENTSLPLAIEETANALEIAYGEFYGMAIATRAMQARLEAKLEEIMVLAGRLRTSTQDHARALTVD